jgi:hypothetical protein
MPRLAMVAAALWDLRAQLELEMRTVTDAQRVIDGYRDHPESQSEMKRRLQADLQIVRQTHAAATGCLDDCERFIHELPISHPPT